MSYNYQQQQQGEYEFGAMESPSLPLSRRLEEDEDSDVTGNSDIIKNTLRVYGSFYFASIVLFEFLRRRYPRLYNIRSWVPEQECELAKTNTYPGYFSWFWKVFQISDQEVFDQVGMDALCFLRALRFCRQISIVGVINAMWLLPIYRTAKESPETAEVTDGLDRFTLANLPASSMRFFATVLSAYILVLSTMYFLHKEFKWYTYWRHKFLSRRVPRNYAVYVYGIPREFRSSHKLATYFRNCSSTSAVLEAHVAMDTPNLESMQSERENVIKRLEHIAGVENRREGKLSRARKGFMVMDKDDLVRSMEQRLAELNKEIPRRIHEVMAINDRFRSRLTRLQSTKDLLGDIELGEASPEEAGKNGFFAQPTIDENATMEFPETTPNMRSTLTRNGTSVTFLSNMGENGSESPVAADFDDDIHEEEKGEEVEDYCYEESDQALSDSVASNVRQQVFDSSDRAFLSIFLPDAEGLLPEMGYTRNSLPPIADPAGEDDFDEVIDTEKPATPANDSEIPSSVSLVDDHGVDLESQKFLSILNPSEVSESDIESDSGENVFREGGRRSSRPGIPRAESKASSTSSQGSKGAFYIVTNAGKTIAKGTTDSISRGTRNASKTIAKGSKFTKETLTNAGTVIAAGSRTAKTTMMKAAKDIKVDKLVHQAGNFVPVVINKGEGEPRSGGFVVFTNLYTAQTALQMVHHSVPYVSTCCVADGVVLVLFSVLPNWSSVFLYRIRNRPRTPGFFATQ